ncbi:hypothetical protein ADUPG1_011798, partial [Aduncisulcus paluster]
MENIDGDDDFSSYSDEKHSDDSMDIISKQDELVRTKIIEQITKQCFLDDNELSSFIFGDVPSRFTGDGEKNFWKLTNQNMITAVEEFCSYIRYSDLSKDDEETLVSKRRIISTILTLFSALGYKLDISSLVPAQKKGFLFHKLKISQILLSFLNISISQHIVSCLSLPTIFLRISEVLEKVALASEASFTHITDKKGKSRRSSAVSRKRRTMTQDEDEEEDEEGQKDAIVVKSTSTAVSIVLFDG